MSSWRPARKRSWLDLTPLIDVVFTLLIFVVVTAQFTSEDFLAVELPRANLSSAASLPPVIVSLDRDGSIAVEGVPAELSGAGPAILAQLKEPDRGVLLRADAEVPYGKVFELISVLGKSGIEDVGLAYAPGL